MRMNVTDTDVWMEYGMRPVEEKLFYNLNRLEEWGVNLKIPKELPATERMQPVWPSRYLDDREIALLVYGLSVWKKAQLSAIWLQFGYFDPGASDFYLIEDKDQVDSEIAEMLDDVGQPAVLVRLQYRGQVPDRTICKGGYLPWCHAEEHCGRYSSGIWILPMAPELEPMRSEVVLQMEAANRLGVEAELDFLGAMRSLFSHPVQLKPHKFFQERAEIRESLHELIEHDPSISHRLKMGLGTIELTIPSERAGKKFDCVLVLEYASGAVNVLKKLIGQFERWGVEATYVNNRRLADIEPGQTGSFYNTEHNLAVRWYALPVKIVCSIRSFEEAAWIPKPEQTESVVEARYVR